MRILLFLLVFSNFCFAQVTIDFRDGKKLSIKGDKIGTWIDYELDNPTEEKKLTEYYAFKEGEAVTVYEYKTWLTKGARGSMDELRIYTFKKEQFESSPAFSEEVDEEENPKVRYRLHLSAKEDAPISCGIYNKYESIPKETRALAYVTFYAIEKAQFEQLAQDLALPVEEDTDSED